MLRLASEPEAVPLTAISSELGSAPEREAELPLRLLPQASGRLADAPPSQSRIEGLPQQFLEGTHLRVGRTHKPNGCEQTALYDFPPLLSCVCAVHSFNRRLVEHRDCSGCVPPRSQCFNAVLEGHQM